MKFRIKDLIDDSYGKLSNGADKFYGFFEFKYIHETISEELGSELSEFAEEIKTLSPKDFAG